MPSLPSAAPPNTAMNNKLFKLSAALFGLLLFSGITVGCEDDSDLVDSMDDAGDSMNDSMEDMNDSMDETADDMDDAMDDANDAMTE